MNSEQQSSSGRGRLLRFRHRRSSDTTRNHPPVADLAKYERSGEHDDYRHRMLMNAIAFVFVIALIGAGVWIADTMAAMRKNQDCVLSGRRGCTPVEVSHDRW
ncbi:MAG: hypothetical protein ACR2K5_08560 [Pseudolabrys sp.]